MRAELADWPGIVAHADYIQYAIEDYPVRVIMLDTLVRGFSHGELGPERLAWLDDTLAAQPERPTLIAMHHPPFVTAIPHMDRIALRDAGVFTDLIARHRQVQRIICGHHHRSIFGACAHAVVSISPSIAHQVAWTLDADDEGALNFEPPAFHLHLWQPSHGIVSHTLYVDSFPGPFPFLSA
jgi:3',5'-cyclic-AMP phosphodiesterase